MDDITLPEPRDATKKSAFIRRRDARKFRNIFDDLREQMSREPTASEQVMLTHAAALAFLCEEDARALILRGNIDIEGYRRNLQALRALLQSLGLAKKSRDVTKKSFNTGDSILSQLVPG
jgi:hypothetical protein